MPWGVTDWRVPRVFRGGNEWCSPSLAFVVPPFGCLVVFWKPGRRRTVPCPACWQVLDDAGRADYAPCGRYHGGRLNQAGHAHWETGVCGEAERWLEAHSPGAVLPGEFGRPGG